MSAVVLTTKQRHILRHALGLTRRRRPYRNHYVTNPEASTWETVQSLVQLGYMSRGEPISDSPSNNVCFYVSPHGVRAVHPRPRRTRVPDGVEMFLDPVSQKIDDVASELARVVEGNPDIVSVDIVISRSQGGVARAVSVARRKRT